MRCRTWLLIVLITMAGCTQGGGATGLLPDVPNAKVVEGQTITQSIGKLSDGAVLMTGNPELGLVLNRVENTMFCFQNIGAVTVRAYSDQTFPLSAGMVAIADRNAAINPANAAACLAGRGRAQTQQLKIQPCAKSYTLQKDNNEFYIAYMATTQAMCDAFCSKLEGCTK